MVVAVCTKWTPAALDPPKARLPKAGFLPRPPSPYAIESPEAMGRNHEGAVSGLQQV